MNLTSWSWICEGHVANMTQKRLKKALFPDLDLDPGFGVGGCPELVALQGQGTVAEVAQVASASFLSPSTL